MTLAGSCHCGRVTIALDRAPVEVTGCNCTSCYKHGVLWAYFAPGEVRVVGETASYVRADVKIPATDLRFCAHCGCTTHWAATEAYVRHAGVDDRMGVNMRLFDEELLTRIPVRVLEGRSWDVDEEWAPVSQAGEQP